MPRHRTTTASFGDDGTVTGIVYGGSRPRFDRSWGNYVPGEPVEVDDLCVRDAAGLDITGALSDEDLKRAEEALVLQAEEDAINAKADADDRAIDARRGK